MRTTYPPYLACPMDVTPLIERGGQLCCAQGHHFDIARQGYVNLLPVQQKKSKQPGDNKEMVAARTQFLESRLYQPIAEQLAHIFFNNMPDALRTYGMLDAGCGDGYYLDYIIKALPKHNIVGIGVDISKYAVMAATKRNTQLTWLVGSNKQLPVLSDSVDIILSVFGFPSVEGFANALNVSGKVILVEPNVQHLIELRKWLYTDVDESPSHKIFLSPNVFHVEHTQNLTYQTRPLTNSELVNLLKMTPHFYRAPKEAVELLCRQSNISVTVDVNIMVCAKRRAVDDQ